MKTIFCLLFFVFLFCSPASACSPDYDGHAISQVSACTSYRNCYRECKQELIEVMKIGTWRNNNPMACGKKACGVDLECKKKITPLNECDF